MKLSMWILYENLGQYEPKPHIIEGQMCIRNASLLYHSAQVTSHTVYICPSEEFFETMKGKIICVNRNDYIILETDDMEEAFETISRIIDFFLEWDLNVHEAIEGGCTLKEVLLKARPVIALPLFVMDTAFIIQELDVDMNIINPEYRPFIRVGSGMPIRNTVRYVQDFKLLRMKKEPYLYTADSDINGKGLFINLYVNDICQCHCMLFLENGKTCSFGLEQLYTVLGRQLERWLKCNGYDNTLSKQERNLLDLLDVREETDVLSIQNDFLRAGWEDCQEKYLCIAEHIQKSDLLYTHIIHMFAPLYPACQCVLYCNCIVFLINTAMLPLQEFIDHITGSFPREDFSVGFSLPFKGLSGLREPYLQAQIAIQEGRRNGKSLSFCREHIMNYAKNFCRDNLTVNLAHPLLAELEKEDEKKHTEYFETLRAYLLEEQSQTRTAQVLGVHKKTVQYRIQSIRERYDLDLSNQTERLHLLLSFLLFYR